MQTGLVLHMKVCGVKSQQWTHEEIGVSTCIDGHSWELSLAMSAGGGLPPAVQ